MKTLRIYADTSVIGGCLDDEFADPSRKLIGMARAGRIVLLLSDILASELVLAPAGVQDVFARLAGPYVEAVESSLESRQLRDAYLAAKVVGAAQTGDAHHVALATVVRADLIVSWNFKHIVHYDKIRLFNAVNLREGYPPIDIRTPWEVVS
ncbi:MAG: hypothetical protein ACUVXJ_13125 [Phycisphaerae bacterium]